MRPEDATHQLASFVVETASESLPTSVLDAAKTAVVDGIGCLVAGSRHPVGSSAREYALTLGGVEESTVVATDDRLPASLAAWVNGVSLHCLDYEVQGDPPTHGTSTILPGVLALGEKHGATGQDALAAFVIGWDIQQRIRSAGAKADLRGFHYPGVIGPLAAAAAASRMLRLDVGAVRRALGIAASQTGGLFANNGTMTKATHPGNAARTGVQAAEMAGMGYTASETVLGGPTGYVNAVFGSEFDWDVLVDGLGERFHVVEPGFSVKRYPAEIYMQWIIQAAADLRLRTGLSVEEVERATVTPPVYKPYLSRANPESGLDGKFSYEYCVALGLAEERVGLASFTDDVRFSQPIENLLPRIEVNPRAASSQRLEAQVTLQTKDGREFSETCHAFLGNAANPMSDDEHLAKVRDCFSSVGAEARTNEVTDLVDCLETVGDLRDLMKLLAWS